MASPSPLSPPSPTNNKLDYYYFVIGLALVAIILLVTNAVAVGCCTWLRQLLSSRSRQSDAAAGMQQWIPAVKFSKKGRGDATPECAVCLSAFDDGDVVRELPTCGHAFHAECIDKWLSSQSSCPICRGSVLPTPSHSMDLSAQFHSQVQLIEAADGGGGSEEGGV